MVNSIEIEYLEPKREFRVGNAKNIAVPSKNKDDIKKMFPGLKKTESNADMLAQSFGAAPEITPIPSQSEPTEPVQITSIPVIQNSNLESSPVSLSTTTPVMEPITNTFPDINNNETIVNIPEINNQVETPIVTPIPDTPVVPEVSVAESQTPIIESGFKVSDAPNIFDNPTPVVPVEENQNVFSQPVLEEQNIGKEKVSQNDIDNNVIETEIAILESDIKHYEGLAENNRKKIELLKKQIKKENDVNLENTASNLFNSKGFLDEEQVFGESSIPTLRVA